MVENENVKEKKEVRFDEKLAGAGWPSYFLSAKIENLGNPDQKQGTLGFVDAMTKKQVVVNAPVEEWIRALTELAKKQGNKA